MSLKVELNSIPSDGVDVKDLRIIFQEQLYIDWEYVAVILEEFKEILKIENRKLTKLMEEINHV